MVRLSLNLFAPYPPRAIPAPMRSLALAFATVCCPPAAGLSPPAGGDRVISHSTRDLLLSHWHTHQIFREVGLPPDEALALQRQLVQSEEGSQADEQRLEAWQRDLREQALRLFQAGDLEGALNQLAPLEKGQTGAGLSAALRRSTPPAAP